MNRRRAITKVVIGSVAAVSAAYGIKWGLLHRSPDVSDIMAYQPLLDELADTIIPATDTPGAKDAEVGAFICIMIKDCTEAPSQNNFLNGLKDLESYCHSEYKQSFIKCDANQRESVLTHFEKKGNSYQGIIGKIQKKLWGKAFFPLLKEYTVIGYCTSREGANKGLAYDFIPVTYEACIPYKPLQKSWATK